MQWLRLYHEIIDDPKTGTLKDAEFRLYVEMLCLASKAGHTGDTGQDQAGIEWCLRKSVARPLGALVARGLVSKIGGTFHVANWNKRQFRSDDVGARVKKHRGNGEGNDVETLPETLQDRSSNGVCNPPEQSRAETEQKQRARKRATRLPKPFELTQDWREIGRVVAEGLGHQLNIGNEWAKFCDHWWGVSGSKGVKDDWLATWRNWIRKACEFAPKGAPRIQPPASPEEQAAADLRNRAQLAWGEVSTAVKLGAPVRGADAQITLAAVERIGGLDTLKRLPARELQDKSGSFAREFGALARAA